MARKIRKIVRRFPKKDRIKCIRCNTVFSGVASLKVHSRTHLQKMKEMSMLEEGSIPSESKIGSSFKGKNRIIIA